MLLRPLVKTFNAVIIEEGGDSTVEWIYIRCIDHEMVITARTYREGMAAFHSPTPEDIEKGRDDPWYFWNSDKAIDIY